MSCYWKRKNGKNGSRDFKRKGGEVFITLRSYHSGKNVVPRGCLAIDYIKRCEVAKGADFIISATSSPHYTITVDDIKKMRRFPKAIIDIAMPRDIDPNIFTYNQIECYNIDNLGIEYKISDDDMKKIFEVIDKYKTMFYKWYEYKIMTDVIIGIKKGCSERIKKSRHFKKYSDFENFSELADEVLSRGIDMIFGELKNHIDMRVLKICDENIRKKADLKK